VAINTNKTLRITTIWVLFLASGLLDSGVKVLAAETNAENLCSIITLDKAAVILSVPEDDLHKNYRELMISPEDIENKTYKQPPVSCSIQSKSNFLKMVTFVIYVFNDSSLAQQEFDKMKQGFETVSKVNLISGMGEKAFWVEDSRVQRLVARKNSKLVDILNPKDFNTQTHTMHMILEKL